MLRRFLYLPSRHTNRPLLSGKARLYSSQAANDEELAAARKWLANFDAETLPKSLYDFSFSRSSGPGGQNVNKLNSKARLSIPLSTILPHIPTALHSSIRNSRYCAQKSNALIIQCEDSRKQTDNVQACLVKLNNLIIEAARDVIPGETSDAQRSRVKNLQKVENETRLKTKKQHSQKKNSRRGGNSSDY
ncbi:peptidyl-tRNA hydrolase domain protein [Aulographum hederae CBS 113979]|uniref:Peptidyl-tRNA hydrolase domain protein n=1 Tax=Aulographum hederae CBS 113979 TaxID=1176131 RepID=A0A6G1H5A2_9PEZI|nr:peptidyl-tRNA hydrolase domain protein [Aulographum hederae CBS 113979]